MAAPSASASPARRRRAAGVPYDPSLGLCGRGGGVPADVLDIEPSRDVAASHPSLFAAPYASPTQVKVEKKDEGIEAMRKLMGGAADEDEEEAG